MAAIDTSGTRRLQALVEAGIALGADLTLDQILDRVVGAAADLTDARYAAVAVVGKDGIERFVHAGMPPEVAALLPRPRGGGVLARALRERRPVRLADVSADPEFSGFPPGHPGVTTFIAAPVLTGDDVYGAVYAAEKDDGAEFTEGDEDLLVKLAAFTAGAIGARHARDAAQSARTNDETVEAARRYVESAENLWRSASAALERSRRVRRESVSAILKAQESERRRIGRDLHDQTGQDLTAAALVLDKIARAVPGEGPAADAVEELRAILRDTHASVRRIAAALRPAALEEFGLEVAVEHLVELAGEGGGLEATAHCDLGGRTLPSDVETTVYRVVQEALTNVLRHAAAQHVHVTLTATPSAVVAEVVDDGVGIDPAERGGGTGLSGSRERLALVGGGMSVRPGPRGGTRVLVEVPVP